MAKVQFAFTALALAAAACSPPASETTPPQAPASAVPTEIAAVVSAAAPGITITNGELGNSEYDVTGTKPNGEDRLAFTGDGLDNSVGGRFLTSGNRADAFPLALVKKVRCRSRRGESKLADRA
jgi:hypothetical protein